MPKSMISNNLQSLIKLHGDLSLSDLARKTDIPQPTLHHILEGKTKKPRRKALEALANFFSISVTQLVGSAPLSSNIPDKLKLSLKISTVPLIDWNLAKSWENNKTNMTGFNEIILEKHVSKHAFALTMLNASMEPLFQENSILIFDPAKTPKERDFVLVYFSKNDSLIFNRLFTEGKNFYIKKDKNNGDAELIKLNFPQDRIVATLIEARISF